MGKFDGWLIATDLDGTLIDDLLEIPQKNIDAIRYFQNEGGLFTIATGRSLAMCHGYLEQLHLNAPAVLINGTLIYDTIQQKPVWQTGLDRNIAGEMLARIGKQFPDICAQIHGEGPIAIVSPDSCTDQFITKEKLPRVLTTSNNVADPWYKIMFYATPARLRELEEYVQQTIEASISDHFCILYSAPYYLEMMPVATNKGTGLLHLAEILNIEHSKTVAIGDYFNDADMIRMAGTGVAVSNAPKQIRDLADLVVGSNNDGAISDLITYLELNSLQTEE
jgi:Cof subfamily protein (haloacid dehalogenase superfamily)